MEARVQTKKALVVVVGMALLVLLTLSPKAVDMDNPPVPEQSPPVDTNCYPASTNVLCAPEPGPVFLSTGVTNQCNPAAMIVAWATYTNLPGKVTTTITYSNASCPPLVTTNEVSSAILTNWWDAGWTNGGGLTASFSPTNCGGGTVYFYITYSNTPPCSNATTISASIDYDIDRACGHHSPAGETPIPILGSCGHGSTFPPWSTNSLCSDTFSVSCDGVQVHANSPDGPCGVCPYDSSWWNAWYTFCLCKAKIMETRFDVWDRDPNSPTYRQGTSSVWTCSSSCTFSNFTGVP